MYLSYARTIVAILCLCIMFPSMGMGAEIECELVEWSGFDNSGISIEPFFKEPRENLMLPEVREGEKWFFEKGVPASREGDRIAYVMVVVRDSGDVLYIDRNNDEDLTNDGGPAFFPRSKNDFWLYMSAQDDPNRKTGMLYQRKPRSVSGRPDTRMDIYDDFVDSLGNVLPIHARVMHRDNTDFEGKVGTFYYTSYLHLRRGKVRLSGQEYQVALYDGNFNGRFDSKKDRLIVDLDRVGGILRKSSSETFRLSDVFAVGQKRYKLSYIDLYGRSIRLTETEEQPTSLFAPKEEPKSETRLEESVNHARELRGRRGRNYRLQPAFWDLQFKTIDGSIIRMADSQGKYILLNFWGEWCAPCVKEIPALVKARDGFPEEKMVMIGMLKTMNLDAARQMIQDRKVTWPQVLLEEDIFGLFNILSYPTNILIMPDGESYLEAGLIGHLFFTEDVK